MLRITHWENGDGQTVLLLEGRIAGPWAAELERACGRVLAHGGKLALDMEQVEYLDPAAIRLVRELVNRRVSLLNLTPFIRELLRGAESR
jgi:anti-anti-sigma regulatory factor